MELYGRKVSIAIKTDGSSMKHKYIVKKYSRVLVWNVIIKV